MKIRSTWAAAAVGLAALAGCDSTTGAGGDATVRVLLTDAPADYIEAAWVDIGDVQLIPADQGGPITLSTDGTDGLVDLLELQDAATALLAEADVEPGEYHQLRLIVEDARVELADGYQFNDGSTERPLFIPSGAQTGLKLNLGVAEGESQDEEAGLYIAAGETVLVLDFDVNQSFVIQGNPETPAGINGILFTPTIRVAAEDVAGRIAGTVTTGLQDVDVSGLVVTAEPEDEGTLDDYQSTTATATTRDDGSYTLHFLVPGTYTVSVAPPEGLAVDPATISVSVEPSEEATGVDFDIISGG